MMMRTPRQSAIRLLQSMIVAIIVLPAILFVFASWLNYRHTNAVADERIGRSLDILSEHALKVFQTVERAIAEIDEMVRGLSDEEIRRQEAQLHVRLAEIVRAMPQLHAIGILDKDGRDLVTSLRLTAGGDTRLAVRSYFQAQAERDAGTYVSEVVQALRGQSGRRFFVLSRRRLAAEGAFNGITAVAVLPDYFKDFYARIGRAPGSYYSMIRDDGAVLARFPSDENTPWRLNFASSGLAAALAQNAETGLYTTVAQLDHIERRLGYRKLEGFPVFMLAGIETSAIRSEWLDTMLSHLYFGLPATFIIFLLLALALRRTHRLHDEAEKREAAEAALRQAQRLEAIGQLTGGVAHDFNNLLMIVSGNVQRLKRELPAEKYGRYLDMIATAAQRGETLTRQLLTFSRRQTLTPEVIDLSRRLPEMKEMLSRSLRGDIETEVVVPDAPTAVKVDPSELELALLNLAVNAQDAMPNGGTLGIKARAIRLTGQSGEEGLTGDFVAIRVADTGAGIPPDILPKVFEPFFTTKDVGRGTGLGLSQVYGFARQSGGTATVSSVLGAGTVVTLYLPRSREAPAKAAAPAETAVAPKRAGKVLLVEDNAEVADVCMSYFQQIGYEVRHAESAQEALEAIENEGEFDLVFSDILMPGLMNGLDLAKAIRDRFPRLPVVLATGYSTSAQEAVREGFIVVQKPFEFSALDQSIREALRGRKAAPVSAARKAFG